MSVNFDLRINDHLRSYIDAVQQELFEMKINFEEVEFIMIKLYFSASSQGSKFYC